MEAETHQYRCDDVVRQQLGLEERLVAHDKRCGRRVDLEGDLQQRNLLGERVMQIHALLHRQCGVRSRIAHTAATNLDPEAPYRAAEKDGKAIPTDLDAPDNSIVAEHNDNNAIDEIERCVRWLRGEYRRAPADCTQRRPRNQRAHRPRCGENECFVRLHLHHRDGAVLQRARGPLPAL